MLFGEFISWSAKRQQHIALSSAEAECVSMSWVCREVTSMRELHKRLLGVLVVPIIYEDNLTAFHWSSTEESTNLKHVNLCFHFIHLEVANGNVKIVWVPTIEQLADAMAKPLGP